MKYIDLFAGAGGLSEGFTRAGFQAIAHIEMNQDAAQTLKTRIAYWHLRKNGNLKPYYSYLKGKITHDKLYDNVPANVMNTVFTYKMNRDNLDEIFRLVDNNLYSQGNSERVQLIVGGPPCQAFSLAGRGKLRSIEELARKNGNDVAEDERKYMYIVYCSFLQRYKPDMFVFENVPGLLSMENGRHWNAILKMLRCVGYNIEFRELNARYFGVPQERKRIIIIGWRKDTPYFYPDFQATQSDWTVSDILADLPSLQSGEENNRYSKKEIKKYVTEHLRTDDDVLTWHIARPHNPRDREIYKIAIHEWIDKHKRLRYKDIPEHLRTHKNQNDFSDRFKVVAPDNPFCHTILAHISKDGHYFIHPDTKQARSLTVREAARIQSFPDSYFFEGSRTSAFTQIGNAVPPLMAERIAEALMEQLRKGNI